MGRFKSQLVYDVHNLHTQEYLTTFSTMEHVMAYCENKHQDQINDPETHEWYKEAYEIKTVVRLYWVEG